MNKLNFTIFVTTYCNMKCSYCYETEYEQKHMSFMTAKQIINFICEKLSKSNTDTLNIKFHGGEPLLAFDKIRFIVEEIDKRDECKLVNVKYSMTTNATLYTEEMNDILKRFNTLSISIDGVKEIHDKNRLLRNGTGTYDILKSNIKKMLDEEFKLTARITVTNLTYQDIFTNFKSIIDIGISNVDIELDFLSNNWKREEIKAYEKNMTEVADYVYELQKVGRCISVPMLTYAINKTKNCICDGGRTSFAITPLGEVYPCLLSVYEPELMLGTVGENMNDKILEKIYKVGLMKNESCIGCMRYDYCATTRCKLINKICTGDYCLPSPVLCASENINVQIGKYYSELIN